MNQEKIIRTTLRIDDATKEKLKRIADAQNRSLHNLIVTVLKEYANGGNKNVRY